MSYSVLGGSAADDANSLRQKYRKEMLKRHPDKGGSHNEFLEVQKAAKYLAQKRASFAALIGLGGSAQQQLVREAHLGGGNTLSTSGIYTYLHGGGRWLLRVWLLCCRRSRVGIILVNTG